MSNENYKLVIGLEIHCQINSKHKLFSLAENSDLTEQNPNTTVTNLEMGIPGILPIVNKDPVLQAIKAGFAFNGTVNKISFFDRKHYFYPDLPSGYQITQFFVPIVQNGYLDIETSNGIKRITIKQMHIESDAGKNIHDHNCSLLDYNRVSVGLIETVTNPDMNSPEEAVNFAKEFHNIMNYIGVCNGDMEKGNFRMDVNISVEDLTSGQKTNRVEIKNLNSFNNMIKAINYEFDLHINGLKNNEEIPQSTRFFDANTGKTGLLRKKESSSDYRHIRDNDLPPLILNPTMINEGKQWIKDTLLPNDCRRILMDKGLTEKQSKTIVDDKDQWIFFKKLMDFGLNNHLLNHHFIQKLYNLVTIDLANLFNKTKILPWDSCLTIDNIFDLLINLENKKITNNSFKILLEDLWNQKGNVATLIKEKNMEIIEDNSIIINGVKDAIANNPEEVLRYKNGEIKLFQFFVGQVMKLTKGKGNPDTIKNILNDLL